MLEHFLIENLDIIYGVYGLCFVILGISIVSQPRKGSIYKISGILWLLAAFGLTHGFSKMLEAIVLIKRYDSPLFDIFRFVVLLTSYIFLLEFGRRLISSSLKKPLTKWITLAILFITIALIVSFEYGRGFLLRYALGFPGGVLTGFGFAIYYASNENTLRPLKVRPYFLIAAASFFVYGILQGIIVREVPAQLFCALCAMITTLAVWKILYIFNWEMGDKLQYSFNVSASAIDAERQRTRELEKAYKELADTHSFLIQVEKMNAVGLLASGVAHEVKNPLAVILQSVNYLEEHVPQDGVIGEVTSLMKANIKQADNIIRLLVDFSRASELSLGAQDINTILDNSLHLIKHKFNLANIKVDRDVRTQTPKIHADAGKLTQVFINIFLNAVQAMPKGGNLFIRSFIARPREMAGEIGKKSREYFADGEKAVVVEIEDTGVGISRENLKRVGDPFFTTKGPKGGTGLGLAVTKGIIDAHKGAMEIRSEEGSGTKVIITLKVQGEK